MERGARGAGIPVDPARVREARLEAGLSLAKVAKDDVSRTFIHFIETGRARPSKRVLALIAKRTRKPVDYFLPRAPGPAESGPDLELELKRLAELVREYHTHGRLTRFGLEAMKMVEVSLRQGAALTRAVLEEAAPEDQRPGS